MIRISSPSAGRLSQTDSELRPASELRRRSKMRGVGSFLAALTALFTLGSTLTACDTGGVGDPCTPEDEYLADFAGFSIEEVNVESRSFQCETRVCLVNHFQGRVKCPYGNPKSPNADPAAKGCVIPGTSTEITATVDPQLVDRPANNAVYCSCRCAGPEKNAKYCECPSGFSCQNLVDDYKIQGSAGQLAGSYCIREGTEYVKGNYASHGYCKATDKNCGEVSESGEPL